MYKKMYTLVMSRRYSVAEARANLPSILDAVESGTAVELTRRGKPVAVVMSVHAYERLRGERADFGEAYRSFLKQYGLAEIGFDMDWSNTLRDRSEGRKVTL